MIPQFISSFPASQSSDVDTTSCHEVFFEEIARRASDSRRWKSIACGLVLMRMLEAWADGEQLEKQGLRAVRKDLDELDDETTPRAFLVRLLESMRSSVSSDFAAVASSAAEYARHLECDGDWRLAADVYKTVVRRLSSRRSAVVIRCYIRLGFCYRNLNWVSLADTTFEQARELAMEQGDLDGELRAEMGKSRLAMVRGNYPAAESVIRRVLDRAQGRDLADVRARALFDLAAVESRHGDDVRAAAHAFEALTLSQDEIDRDRIIADLGYFLIRLGRYDAARDACLVTAYCAKERIVRCAGYINLMEVESRTGNRSAFERYSLAVSQTHPNPELTVYYRITLGEGLLRFGEPQAARHHLRDAHVVAVEHGMNQCVLEVERLLASSVPEVRANVPASGLLADIATALRELRAIANV